jgi:hypothetical protein
MHKGTIHSSNRPLSVQLAVCWTGRHILAWDGSAFSGSHRYAYLSVSLPKNALPRSSVPRQFRSMGQRSPSAQMPSCYGPSIGNASCSGIKWVHAARLAASPFLTRGRPPNRLGYRCEASSFAMRLLRCEINPLTRAAIRNPNEAVCV